MANTGGTIGMARTGRGYEPAPGHLERLLVQIPRLNAPEMPALTIHELEPLLDSANMTPADWERVAGVIRARRDDYDGFLVLHGTDTLAYTSSALSYLLQDLGRPIILTGSQIPLAETRNDAVDNLVTSLLILAQFGRDLSGVFVYFHNRLYRGNRVTKVNADAFDAFASPGFPPVGQVGINLDLDRSLLPVKEQPSAGEERPVAERSLETDEPVSGAPAAMGAATVVAIRLFPGLQARTLRQLLEPPVQGAVLECYGAGNGPGRDAAFLEVLRAAHRRGVVLVAVTQPLVGSADLDLYATGRALRDAGVVSGYDMTVEAALTKLLYLFAWKYPPEQVRRLVGQNLCGELTPPDQVPTATSRLRRSLARFRPGPA